MRKWLDRSFWLACGGCAVAALVSLAGVVGAIASRGLPALDPRAAGAAAVAGELVWPAVGTLLLVATALAVAAPVAVAAALASAYYLAGRPAGRLLSLLLYALNGVPSVVFGLFGFAVFGQFLGWGKSWLAGGIVLGLMILPTLTVALAERIAALPPGYLAAAAGLGLPRPAVVRAVILPQARGGLVSGALLGLARAAGETAPILFTAAVFTGATWPRGIVESPVLALPYRIFVLAQDSFDAAAGGGLWGAALLLLALVIAASLAALPARLAAHEEARHG